MNQQEIKKEASLLLNTINQGVVNIPKIKNFLSRLGAEPPTGRKSKMKERIAKYEATLK